QLKLNRIDEEELNQLSDHDLEVLAIFRVLNRGYKFSPQIVKNNDVTQIEFAQISEHLETLPGVNTIIDWERSYLYGDTLRTVLGAVTSTEEGLPADELDNFLSLGYSRNDRVGRSY